MDFNIKKYFLLIFLFSSCIVFSQTDTTELHGTIKITRQKDSTYIKAFAMFQVFPEQGKKSDISYMTYVQWAQTTNPAYANDRVVLKEPSPDDGAKFIYTKYFQKNIFSKDVRMRKGECDTVNFFVTVDKSGNVMFRDVLPVESLGEATVVYSDMSKRKYKIDVSHIKTYYAFSELAKIKWVPAKILTLKKHPSKQKEKYASSDAYAQGILTVIYSSVPFKD